jgi:hypothetical protein
VLGPDSTVLNGPASGRAAHDRGKYLNGASKEIEGEEATKEGYELSDKAVDCADNLSYNWDDNGAITP